MTLLTSTNLIIASTLLRIGFLLFGLFQDAYMPVPYTDIDYLVFTDAARYVSHNLSPYLRETYRYTPLLSWIVLPSVTTNFYSFGKALFVLADLITGIIILKLLDKLYIPKLSETKKLTLASLWLLNPMVITISTRGSSESVLCVFVMLFIYLLFDKKLILSGILCGLSVHFKIYPVIYIPSVILYLTNYSSITDLIKNPLLILNAKTIKFLTSTVLTFIGLGYVMYSYYGQEFLEHAYLYHLSRVDHRHNFSVYNISLYFTSALQNNEQHSLDFTKWAFVPQLFISGVLIPLLTTRKTTTAQQSQSLLKTFFLQTFTFVTFNKVITSQYFIWYLIFLPFTLSNSPLLSTKKFKGLLLLGVWVGTQAGWLYQGYKLEFLGDSVFFPGMLIAAIAFFAGNVLVLGEFIGEV